MPNYAAEAPLWARNSQIFVHVEIGDIVCIYDVTIQTAEFDGMGRRMKKVVDNSGDLDGTVVYFYDGWKICETRDGSNNVYQQMIHGTRYIDELVMVRVADKGDLYVHQDANWNVIGLTDMGFFRLPLASRCR